MRDNADRPLEAIETEMRLQASPIMHEVSLHVNLRRSEPVVRGGVEPPTFRFSVLRITVHSRPPRFICLAQNPGRPLVNFRARTRMRRELRRRVFAVARRPGLRAAPRHPAGHASNAGHAAASSASATVPEAGAAPGAGRAHVGYAVLRLRGHHCTAAAALALSCRSGAELVPAYVRSAGRWLTAAAR